MILARSYSQASTSCSVNITTSFAEPADFALLPCFGLMYGTFTYGFGFSFLEPLNGLSAPKKRFILPFFLGSSAYSASTLPTDFFRITEATISSTFWSRNDLIPMSNATFIISCSSPFCGTTNRGCFSYFPSVCMICTRNV